MPKIDLNALVQEHCDLQTNAKHLLEDVNSWDSFDNKRLGLFIAVCGAMLNQITKIFDMYDPYVSGRYRKDDEFSFYKGAPKYVKRDYARLYLRAEILVNWADVNYTVHNIPSKKEINELLTSINQAVEDFKEDYLDYLAW